MASVEPQPTLSEAMKGNSNAKKEKNSGSVTTAVSAGPRKQKRDAAYWIARLKRDAATDPQAEALLGPIEAGIDPVSLARLQSDPESPEYIDPKGGRPRKEETHRNTIGFHPDSKPGILRRLARERPDLLDRIKAGV